MSLSYIHIFKWVDAHRQHQQNSKNKENISTYKCPLYVICAGVTEQGLPTFKKKKKEKTFLAAAAHIHHKTLHKTFKIFYTAVYIVWVKY